LRRIREDDSGSLFLVPGLSNPFGAAKTLLTERWIPCEAIVIADQNVGVTITIEVDKFQIRIVPIKRGK
jgi:hypothetical protein